MKKGFKVVTMLFCIVLCVFLVTGCGKDLSKYAGTYEGKYTKFVGDPDSAKEENEEFSLELKEDGTGKSNRNGASYNITWEINGEEFKMTEKFIGTIEYNGTLKDGKLHIYNGDKTNDLTAEYVYEKK